MRFSLEESQMKRRIPLGFILLIPSLIFWFAFILGEGIGIGTAKDVFALFASFGIWGFVLAMVACPLLALVLSFRDYVKEKGSKVLDGWVILFSMLFLLMAGLALIFRPSKFI